MITLQNHLCIAKILGFMKRKLHTSILGLVLICFAQQKSEAQITLLKDYTNNTSAPIGVFQNIAFREGGFSSMYAIPETNGKEFWTVSDRGVNVDGANANDAACHPTYDKIYGFPGYAPKIHRIRIDGDSIQILKTITMKRPNGLTATGLLNPAGYGSTATEQASTDTVKNCVTFNSKVAQKDIWGIDSEGIVVDKEGNFWICEEGGPTIWKLNSTGIVLKRFTPYANLPDAQVQDVMIDTVFKYRKNNRGFEGISITPNGKIYAIIQSPLLYPNVSTGENTQIHRILEINPVDNSTRLFVYLNEGLVGSGADQIRLRDWKIGDMSAINNTEFLVMEAGARGTTDEKKIYKINISGATPVTNKYKGITLEGLKDKTGLDTNNIVPVTKTLFLNLLEKGWIKALDKSEGLAIINDSTIAVGNDNDYGQTCPLADGIAIPTNTKSHVFVFGLQGSDKLTSYILPPSFTPEISLSGNDKPIIDGDSIPSPGDNTHFGNVKVWASVTKDFVIKNEGPVALVITAINFTGADAAEFSLKGAPTFPATIPVGGNLSITVSFTPGAGGTRSAYLNIENNDSDESSYNVLLEGEATFTTGIQSYAFSTLHVYPNPANDMAIIETSFEKQQTIGIHIFNFQGKEVTPLIQENVLKGQQQIKINTSSLSNGIYYVELISGNGSSKTKVVVMH